MRALIIGLALVLSGAASAQQLGYRMAEKLSTPEKVSKAEKNTVKMKAVLRQTIQRLKDAKERNDILQINCVNDKLSAIKGLLKISEEAGGNLNEAAAKSDEELVNHEFTKISIASARVENFRAEVEGCVGEASQYTGKTVVDTKIDSDIRSDDPADEDLEPGVTSVNTERPAPVSGSE